MYDARGLGRGRIVPAAAPALNAEDGRVFGVEIVPSAADASGRGRDGEGSGRRRRWRADEAADAAGSDRWVRPATGGGGDRAQKEGCANSQLGSVELQRVRNVGSQYFLEANIGKPIFFEANLGKPIFFEASFGSQYDTGFKPIF